MSQPPAIYLDHNSTTPIDPAVAGVIAECYAQGYLNPASPHRLGQLARRALEGAKSSIIGMLGGQAKGMQADTLIITSGGTESNNLAVIGLTLEAFEQARKTRPTNQPSDYQVLVSAIEHPSVLGAAEYLARLGFRVRTIAVQQTGVIKLDHLRERLKAPTLVVSVMLANNETGVLQPVEEVAGICREYSVAFHSDAVQGVAKIPVNFRELGADAISFTAHKFNGPRGIGGLLVRHGVALQPILFGGFQQLARRPGTEDVALTAGMERALKLYVAEPQRMMRVANLRDRLQAELVSRVPHSVIIGVDARRLPTTLNLAFPEVNRQAFLMAADLAGIAVATGSACASGSSETSPVLLAMGLPERVAESAIRISLGVTTTAAEIEYVAGRISQLVRELQRA